MNGALSPLWLEVSAYFSWMILGRITTSSGKLDKKSLEPGNNCEPAEIWHTGSEFNAEQHIKNPLKSQACIFFYRGVSPERGAKAYFWSTTSHEVRCGVFLWVIEVKEYIAAYFILP